MVLRCRLLLAAVLSVAVTAAGCDGLQGERRCPGESCSPELASLVEAVAGLPAVTRVEEAVSSWGLDNGTYLEVSLRADVSTRSAARRLAHRVVETAGAAEAGPPPGRRGPRDRPPGGPRRPPGAAPPVGP